MTKRHFLFALAPATLLAGCGGTTNRGLESVHQPVVSRSAFVFDAEAGYDGLRTSEAQRLAGWMSTLRLGYGDQVAIEDPGDNRAARAEIAGLAARYGLILSNEALFTGTPTRPGMVRVVVSRSKASVPGCPDYSRVSQPEFDSNTSSSQGCAINSNLAAMVADPADLVRGELGSGTTDPATAVRAIDAFRKAAPGGAGGTVVKAESAGGK